MNRKTAWMLAIWLPLATAAGAESPTDAGELSPRGGPAGVPADLWQQILEHLPSAIGAEGAVVVAVSGDLAAVRLPSTAASATDTGIYLLERDADAGRWRPVTQISAAGEVHFGDSMLLGSDTLLVAAPDAAGLGLGPGMAYVFQRNVGGSGRWGLVARLAPAAYPPPGAVEVRQLAPSAETPAAAAEAPPAAEPEPEPAIDEAVAEAQPAAEPAEPPAAEPVPGADLRYIVVANMREKPRALALASSLRDQGYPSEIYPNDRGFFIVTLARLPRFEARRRRDEAVAAGDIPADAYLVVGVGFREKISP